MFRVAERASVHRTQVVFDLNKSCHEMSSVATSVEQKRHRRQTFGARKSPGSTNSIDISNSSSFLWTGNSGVNCASTSLLCLWEAVVRLGERRWIVCRERDWI